MSAVDKKVKEAIARELKQNPFTNKTELARKYNVSRGTVFRTATSVDAILAPGVVNHEAKLHAQKASADEAKHLYHAAMKELEATQKELGVFRNFELLKDLIVPQNQQVTPYTGPKQAVPMLTLSDFHVDEVVEPETICGLNEYNLDIARQRVATLVKGAVGITKMLKRESDIDTMVMNLLGDFMSGWIHEELQATNCMTPPEALLEVLNMLTGIIQNILDSGVVKRIRVVCCVGNHARITKRTFFKLRVKTSYEWMMYNLLMQHFIAKGENRVQFQIPTGYFNWVKVLDRDIRCHHGDNMRYNGGVGGIHIPVKKAIAQWNKARHADLDVFGHWHTLIWTEDYVINGSLIGYNAFGEMLKVDYAKAAQAICLIHARYDKTAQYPIVVQD